VGVKFYTNRAVTHEIVRHRPCSFLQESQRYCRYSEDKFDSQVTFIKPMFYEEGSDEYKLWEKAMKDTEKIYLKLLETSTPQAARTVLPNSCKTEIIVYCNLLEWLHIFRLRTTKAAEPSMREVMIPLMNEFADRFPSVFGDLKV
jgi:thymidylate synthase (FAD)